MVILVFDQVISASTNWLMAHIALERIVLGIAVQAARTFLCRIRLVREQLARQRLLALDALEATLVVGLLLVLDSVAARSDTIVALGALAAKAVVVARLAVNLVILLDETLRADGDVATAALEATLVVLVPVRLDLLRARLDDQIALVAARGKVLVVAVGAVELVVLQSERLLESHRQLLLALVAKVALLVPVLVLEAQVFGIDADLLLAFGARMSEQLLVARHAVRLVLLGNVLRLVERLVTVLAVERLVVVFLLDGLGVDASAAAVTAN